MRDAGNVEGIVSDVLGNLVGLENNADLGQNLFRLQNGQLFVNDSETEIEDNGM